MLNLCFEAASLTLARCTMTISLLLQQRVAQEIYNYMDEFRPIEKMTPQEHKLLGNLLRDVVNESGQSVNRFTLSYSYSEPVHLFNIAGQQHLAFEIRDNTLCIQHAPLN
jgi:hypothetical protein